MGPNPLPGVGLVELFIEDKKKKTLRKKYFKGDKMVTKKGIFGGPKQSKRIKFFLTFQLTSLLENQIPPSAWALILKKEAP